MLLRLPLALSLMSAIFFAPLSQSQALGQDLEIPEFEAPDFNAPEFEMPDFDAGQDFSGEGDMSIDFDMEDFEGFGSEEYGDEFQQEAEQAAVAAGFAMMAGIACFAVFGLILTGVVAFLMSDALSSVPEEHQQLSPMVPWLLFVPLINIVVVFLVFIQVPKSLASYLASQGDTSQGDCGEKTGLWGVVLYVIGCTFPIGLVMMVMAILKINHAKKAAKALQ